jgi:outer membrane protein TolC
MSSSLFNNYPIQSPSPQNQNMAQAIGTNPLISTVKLLKQAQNPMTMLETAAQNNPQLQMVYNQSLAMNGDPKSAFYNIAKSKGMTEEQISDFLNTIKSTWNGL